MSSATAIVAPAAGFDAAPAFEWRDDTRERIPDDVGAREDSRTSVMTGGKGFSTSECERGFSHQRGRDSRTSGFVEAKPVLSSPPRRGAKGGVNDRIANHMPGAWNPRQDADDSTVWHRHPAGDSKVWHRHLAGENAGFAPPPHHSQNAVRKYSPGIRIDWQRRLIELDATIVLRKGPLELLACSPNTREHESILVVTGRPRDIYHAMGLIGLTPGSPVRYVREQNRVMPPTGETLRLDVRYQVKGAERTVPARRWLLNSQHRRPPESVNWVFPGSTTIHDGRFGADVDGTVVCVVDFDTALIAVGETHSADNDLLWLEANTKEIPPTGTPCTLIIRSATAKTIYIDVLANGTLRSGGKPVSGNDVVALFRKQGADSSKVGVALRPAPEVTEKTITSVVDLLAGAGVPRDSIITSKAGSQKRAGQLPK